MEGRGEILKPVQCLPRLPLLLVNPGVAVPTKDVFAAPTERRGIATGLPRGRFGDLADLLRFLDTTGNDLEAPALALQPVIGEVLTALKNLPGALFTRMSGSGATCFALMPDDEGCVRAAAMLKEKHPGWWVQPTFVPEIGIAHEIGGPRHRPRRPKACKLVSPFDAEIRDVRGASAGKSVKPAKRAKRFSERREGAHKQIGRIRAPGRATRKI